MNRILAAAAALLLAGPAIAQQGDLTCVVDYETLQVRHLLPTDPESMPNEQRLLSYDWAFDETVTIAGQAYSKYGLPRVTVAGELEFVAFKDSVPFMREVGDSDDPEVLYALYNGLDCEVQPYWRAVN